MNFFRLFGRALFSFFFERFCDEDSPQKMASAHTTPIGRRASPDAGWKWRFLLTGCRASSDRGRLAALSLLLAASCASSAPGTIGAALGQKADHRLFVRGIPPGQAAERAGLAMDDEILAIDGRDVRMMTQDDVRRAVRGDVGSSMIVTILRHGEKREIRVVRTPLLAEGRAQ